LIPDLTTKEEEEEGALLEILSLFTDYVIPGRRDKFAAMLLGRSLTDLIYCNNPHRVIHCLKHF
jgi:hypothetical protein